MEKNRRHQIYNLNGNSSSATDSFYELRGKEHLPSRKQVKHSGSLEIIEGENGAAAFTQERSPSEASSRPWSRASIGSVPPRSDSSLSRRVLTPTKQISLQAVKRKEESSDPILEDVDFKDLNIDTNHSRLWDRFGDEGLDDNSASASNTKRSFSRGDSDIQTNNFSTSTSSSSDAKSVHDKTNTQPETHHKEKIRTKETDKRPSSDDEDDEEEESEVRKAPNELLMEFVDCLMKKDFKNADKLCKMILIYEPENEEALKFQPLIQEKIQLDAEAEAEEDSSDEDDEDDDDDDDDDDSDDDSSSGSSDEDDDEDDDNDTDQQGSSNILNTQPSTSGQTNDTSATKRVWRPAN